MAPYICNIVQLEGSEVSMNINTAAAVSNMSWRSWLNLPAIGALDNKVANVTGTTIEYLA